MNNRNIGRDNHERGGLDVNVTRGMNQYGQAYTYGSKEAADAQNDITQQEYYNGGCKG